MTATLSLGCTVRNPFLSRRFTLFSWTVLKPYWEDHQQHFHYDPLFPHQATNVLLLLTDWPLLINPLTLPHLPLNLGILSLCLHNKWTVGIHLRFQPLTLQGENQAFSTSRRERVSCCGQCYTEKIEYCILRVIQAAFGWTQDNVVFFCNERLLFVNETMYSEETENCLYSYLLENKGELVTRKKTRELRRVAPISRVHLFESKMKTKTTFARNTL